MPQDTDRKYDLRALPSVGSILKSDEGARLSSEYGGKSAAGAIKDALSSMRDSGKLSADKATNLETALRIASNRLAERQEGLVSLINATGIVLHTNLGRAPLSKRAIAAAVHAASGYTNLEYDLKKGERGSRQAHVEGLLSKLVGSEAAIAVNNNAAAVLLCLDALAKGGKVAVSRGELVEIGGSFRVPEIMASTGAVLMEVGTTNRTRAADFERAASEGAVALLKVHPSNFKITGFVSEVGVAELSKVAKKHSIPLIYDIGSGSVIGLEALGLPHEPMPQEAIIDGADLVSFSADKLLGGPQCGIIAGRADLVAKVAKSPLARAFRVDKMRLAALAATLNQYLSPDEWEDVPVMSMLHETHEALLERAAVLATALRRTCEGRTNLAGIQVDTVDTEDEVGGGSVPGANIRGAGVSVRMDGVKPSEASLKLRQGSMPVVALERGSGLVFSVRTVADEQISCLVSAIIEAFSAAAKP
jgi:L-seryl-tRNA(Ser) seleniumtransferase